MFHPVLSRESVAFYPVVGEIVMRFRGLVVLVVAVALSPASAHAGLGLGGFYCQPKMACDQSDPTFPSTAQIVSQVTACVGQNTGVRGSGDLFDSSGIDSSGCLSTNASSFPASSGGVVLPHCCVTAAPGGGCAVYCSMTGQ
jgi:hypothetical protein